MEYLDAEPGPDQYFGTGDDDQNDTMEGVPEAEEAKEKKPKEKKVKISGTGKPRFTLNEKVLCGKNGLTQLLPHFQDTKFSTEPNSEYDNLDLFLSKMERWTHKLYPKWQMELTLRKIEVLGKKNYVKNTVKRIRTMI